jgi:hypothetical protein
LKHTCCIALCALALAGSAESAVIGNGPPNQSGGSDLNSFLEADKFSLANILTISKIAFWTLQGTPADYAGTTFWGIYNDVAGSPGTAIASGNPALIGTPTGNTTFGLSEFSYQVTVNVTLAVGTYWLVLHNGPANTIPATNYYWAWAADAGNSKSRDIALLPAAAWVGNSSALAFQLDTPEPASISLMGSGLLVAWLARRNHKANLTQARRQNP